MTDLAMNETVKATLEAMPEESRRDFLDRFVADYKPPEYAGEMCETCGVRIARRSIHDQFHFDLSCGIALALYSGPET